MNDRINELKNMRKTRDEVVEAVDVPEFCKSTYEPTTDVEWEFYLDLLRTAYDNKKFMMLQKMAFSVMGSKKLQSYLKEVDFLGLLSCIYNREEHYGYNVIKQFVVADSPRLWNLFNLVVLITQDYRYYRYIDRFFGRVNVNPMVFMLSANYYLMSNTYKYALDHYATIFQRHKSPLIALILSVIYAQIASQKYSNRKQHLVLQSIAFIEKYQEIREPEAMNEIYYNTGRLYHQIGMLHLAKSYYEKALNVSNELIEKCPHHLDLRAEIAFNLHLIYKSSGNKTMARKILYDNIIV
jgi:general transcription factor 3C polypeptide 3 (transcription factor C subunit 4)